MRFYLQFDSAGPFMLTLEAPPVARQWEQVGLRACVFNFHKSKVGVLITLPHSDDYRSVLVEENGVVTSYKPRTAAGDHQHIVWVKKSCSCARFHSGSFLAVFVLTCGGIIIFTSIYVYIVHCCSRFRLKVTAGRLFSAESGRVSGRPHPHRFYSEGRSRGDGHRLHHDAERLSLYNH